MSDEGDLCEYDGDDNNDNNMDDDCLSLFEEDLFTEFEEPTAARNDNRKAKQQNITDKSENVVFKVTVPSNRDKSEIHSCGFKIPKVPVNKTNVEIVNRDPRIKKPDQNAQAYNPIPGARPIMQQKLNNENLSRKSTDEGVNRTNRLKRKIDSTAIPSTSTGIKRTIKQVDNTQLAASDPVHREQSQQTPLPMLQPELEVLLPLTDAVGLTLPTFAKSMQRNETAFSFLFGRVCRRLMYNNCRNQSCVFEHNLPEIHKFRIKLNKIDKNDVLKVYDTFFLRNLRLFDMYFGNFTEFFGNNKMTDKLKQMVSECIEREKQCHFNQIIVGFINSGLTYTNALINLVKSIPDRSNRTSKVIVDLILDNRNNDINVFLDILKYLSTEESQYQYTTESMNRLLRLYLDRKVIQLSSILRKIVNETVDEELLNRFMASIEPNADDGTQN